MAKATAAAPLIEDRRAREYELIYILRGTVTPAAAEKVAERVREVITSLDGKLLRVDNWGRRKLAYPIRKQSRGIFVYLRFVGWNDLIAELERNLRLLDDVVRFQTVLLDERVELGGYDVDPEEVKFAPVEEVEEEEEPELAQRLGLVERPRSSDDEGDSSGEGDESSAESRSDKGEDEKKSSSDSSKDASKDASKDEEE
ncbi:MAG: 30S ribosomal protein S6 [Myxococcales bacterium]|jgi:small subunit ribosomal protein S6